MCVATGEPGFQNLFIPVVNDADAFASEMLMIRMQLAGDGDIPVLWNLDVC